MSRHQYNISAVVVNYNGAHLLPRCLSALREADYSGSLEIIVVDNASTDGSADLPCCREDGVRLVRLARNVGFARANNAGAREATGARLLLVNSDCFLRPGAIDALQARLESDPACAVVGPRLLNSDESLQPSCHNFPTPLVLFMEQSDLWKALRSVPLVRNHLHVAGSHDAPCSVDWLAGACLLVRREAFEAVGGFDGSFFFYWEEADLCMRLRKAGWTTIFDPAGEAVHLGGGSSLNPALLGRFFRSLYLLYRKHYAPSRLAAARVVVRSMALFKAGRAVLSSLISLDSKTRREAWRAAHLWAEVARL